MTLFKQTLFIIYPILSLSTLFSQESTTNSSDNKLVKYEALYIDNKVIKLPVFKQISIDTTYNTFEDQEMTDDQVMHDEFDVKWDNTNFDPFGNEELKYPFYITFDDEDFSSPVTHKMVVTSRYGWRRGRPHKGIDIDLNIGDQVLSLLEGKVRYVGTKRGFGKTIVIRHYNGLETVYAHLTDFLVKENDVIKKGQAIGTGGITGNARGSHLHLEVRYHGKSINPEYLLAFNASTKVRSDKFYVNKKWVTPRLHKSTRQTKIIVQKTKESFDKAKINKEAIYNVKKGDTLNAIANRYNMSVSKICQINAIKHNSILKIGQKIVLN